MTGTTLDPAQAARTQQLVESAVAEVTHIATLPEITLKIIDLVEDPDATAKDLHNIIANDPALCARVLKVVNSAFYGLPGQIGSINRAIVLLGLNAVKNIAIAASLAKMFRGGQLCPQFSARDLWSHSIAVAAGVQLLAEKIELGLPDEAFLAGLVHDIGIMVEMQAMRPKLIQTLETLDKQRESFRTVERRIIGADHQDFGAGLCQRWKFPISFAFVTGYHHHPLDLAPEQRTLATLVHVADIAAARAQIGYTKTIDSEEIHPDVLDDLKLTQATVDEMITELPQATVEADALLG